MESDINSHITWNSVTKNTRHIRFSKKTKNKKTHQKLCILPQF